MALGAADRPNQRSSWVRSRANTVAGVLPEAEAVRAVEKSLGRRVEAGAWLCAAPRPGEGSAPFGRGPFLAAIVGDELMTFDVRSPGPAVSRLTTWQLNDLDSRRLSATQLQLSVPLRPTSLTLEAADGSGRQLLDLILRRSGTGHLRWMVVNLVLAAALVFAGYLFRAITIEDGTVSGALPVAVMAAGLMLVLLGILVLGRIRRRKRFFNTPPACGRNV